MPDGTENTDSTVTTEHGPDHDSVIASNGEEVLAASEGGGGHGDAATGEDARPEAAARQRRRSDDIEQAKARPSPASPS